jgi:hypothetical protein
MAQCISSMLILSRSILFIDPHFTADSALFGSNASRFTRPLAEFVRVARTYHQSGMPLQIEVHTSGSWREAPSWSDFEKSCIARLPQLFAVDQKVRVVRWKEKTGGEKLHNRYVITNLGIVQFGHGLDDAMSGSTDDVALLSRDVYELRRAQYMGPLYAFDLDGEVTITGTRAMNST